MGRLSVHGLTVFTCKHCKKPFNRQPNQVRNKDKCFCSQACFHEYARKHSHEYKAHGKNSPMQIKLANFVAIKKLFEG